MISLLHSITDQLSARMYQRFHGPSDFLSAAFDKIEINKPEIIAGRPSKVLDGQFDRVTASPFGGNHKNEVEIARGAPKTVKGTNIYLLQNVTLAKNWLICQKRHEQFCWPKSTWAISKPEQFGEAVLGDSLQGSRYFGHWLRDDCATNLLLTDDKPVLSPIRDLWSDEDFYCDLFGLRPSQKIRHARIQELTYIDDLANNSHKLSRFEHQRSQVRKITKIENPNEIVYVSRGRSARGRSIDNEQELLQVLDNRGVRIVVSEGMDSSDFFKEIFDANLIISAEGSQCAHAIYALRNRAAGLLTLQPHDRFWVPHIEWVRLLEFDFGVVVSDPLRGDFWINPIEVLHTIDLF